MDSQPERSDVFEIEIAPYRLGWFHMRITLDNCCAWIDCDETVRGHTPLLHLEQIAAWPGGGHSAARVEFDDEALDNALLLATERPDGWTHLHISDWCNPDEPPRCDILVRTDDLIREVKKAVPAIVALIRR